MEGEVVGFALTAWFSTGRAHDRQVETQAWELLCCFVEHLHAGGLQNTADFRTGIFKPTSTVLGGHLNPKKSDNDISNFHTIVANPFKVQNVVKALRNKPNSATEMQFEVNHKIRLFVVGQLSVEDHKEGGRRGRWEFSGVVVTKRGHKEAL